MKAVKPALDTSLEEVDDTEDIVYEYGLPEEEEGGFIGTLSNLVAPARREVIKAPEERQVPLEELGMDSIPGETMTVKTPGEYGPVETDFSYAPIVRGAKSVLDYGKKLFSDKKTQEDTVQALKAAPAAAVEGGGKFLEDQMAAAMGMSAGYSSVNRPDGEVARYDPLAFTGAVAPAGIAAVSSAKAGETVLGIFGSTMGMGSKKRFAKYTEEVENADDLQFDTPEAREEYLFQKSKGVFVDEAGDPRFEIATKDVDLLPYFKRRNLIEGTSDSYEVATDPTMKTETVLADVLKFDELFKEYPALKSYRVEPLSEENILDGTTGIFSPSTTTLFVAPQKRKEFLSTLLHEVQHAVDDLEGLQAGSNPEMFSTNIMKEADFKYEQLTAERNNFFSFLTDKETSDSLDKYTPDELKILKSKEHRKLMPIAFSGADFAEPMGEFRDLYKPIIAKMANWEKKTFDNLVQTQKESIELSELANIDSKEAYRKYRGTPGEVDARNVQKRFLNPELQLSSLPKNTADIDKLFGLKNKRGDKVSSVSSETIPASAIKEADALQIGVNPATKNGALLKKYDASIVNSITENSSAATAGTKEANKLINAEVADGTKVGVRLNLNSTIPNMPKGLDKLQTLHKNNYNGKALSYKSFATVEDVTFNVSQKGRRGIAARIKNIDVPEAKSKFPAMSVDGKYNNTRNVLDEVDDDVVEIGFNPANGHLFVDMSTGQAVKSADVATVIGDRVYAKGVTYMKKAEAPDPIPASDGTPLPSEVRYKMKKGGLMARR